jgi:dTDP-4-dehydrorhamnose 3,5-epimerase
MQSNTVVQYYMGDYFRPETYSGFRYNDPFFSVKWPREPALISDRDASFPDFSQEQL